MTTLLISVCLGKERNSYNVSFHGIPYFNLPYNQSTFSHRMCSGTDNVLALPTSFIDSLMGTSANQWTHQMESCGVDVFSYNMIVMPFHHDGQKSLFVVMGAKHIKDYMKANFNETRPCILQILPYTQTLGGHDRAHNRAAMRLRVWLNALWRTMHCNNEFDIASMPFTNRSLPFTQPVGKCRP